MAKKMFDDQTKKYKYGITNLAFKSKKMSNISTWEITRFLADLNTYYYKIELLNSISNAINSGINPENIFILNESFMLNHMYGQMDIIASDSEKLSLLYYIGIPYSLIPSNSALNMRMIFKTFRCINEVLFNQRVNRNSQNTICKYYQYANKKGFNEAVGLLIEDTIGHIKIKKQIDAVTEEIEKKVKIILIEYEKEIRKLDSYNKVKNNIIENRKVIKTPKDFNTFSKTFSRVQRPIVIAFDNTRITGRVLCRNQLNKKVQNESTFTLKKVIHNSPFDIVISGGISALLAISDEKRKKELHAIELERKRMELLKQKTELDTAKITQMTAKFQLLATIKSIKDDDNINQLKKISNPYLKNELLRIQSNVISNYQGLSDKTGLDINFDDTHIDYLA